MRSSETETLTPASEAEAIEEFGDGRDVTVLAGGTILMPDVTYGRYPKGGRTLMLHRAGLERVADNGVVTFGAMATLDAVMASGVVPLAVAAGAVADVEIRGQATIGGNLCAPPGVEAPRGDLQAPLVAMGARVRSVGAGGERTEPVEDYLAGGRDRLVLSIEVDRPGRGAYITQRRAHSHSYSVMAVAAAEVHGAVRIAAAGVAPNAVRLTGVEEALAGGASGTDAAARWADGVDGVDPHDDALASAWYRREVLPVLVARTIEQLQGG
ncbi:MAG: FAD binding domain-containing protein [Solirubrobacteraceae bacterium]